MAGNNDGDAIAASRRADCSHAAFAPAAPCKFGIGDGFTPLYFVDCVPYPDLKFGAAKFQRYLEPDASPREIFIEFRDGLCDHAARRTLHPCLVPLRMVALGVEVRSGQRAFVRQ